MSRTVLITGCSSGIGAALAAGFLAHGDKVIATARRTETLDGLVAKGAVAAQLDVTDEASVLALVAQVEAEIGSLDVLINNAGTAAMGPMAELPADALRSQFETNVFAPVFLTQKCLPLLRKGTDPVVVNISSVSGIFVTPFAGAYCASKAAFTAISEAMRFEFAPLGVKVVCIQPGGIRSSIGENAAAGVRAWLTDQSLYADLSDVIIARAKASQDDATPAEDFTETLIQGLAGDDPAPVQRIGNKSTLLPFYQRWLPTGFRTKMVMKRFGLAGWSPKS